MTDTSPVRDELPDSIVVASFIAGPILTGMGVFMGVVSQVQGSGWPWLPAVMVGAGVPLIAWGILRSSRLTLASLALILLAGRDARRKLHHRMRVIWWARRHGDSDALVSYDTQVPEVTR